MQIKTQDLEGWQLDWAVAKAIKLGHGYGLHYNDGKLYLVDGGLYSPSTQWDRAGPLVAEYDIWISSDDDKKIASAPPHMDGAIQEGDTQLIAICRAIVAAQLGQSVEVPE